jgi:hypothetical protein
MWGSAVQLAVSQVNAIVAVGEKFYGIFILKSVIEQ